MDQSDVELMLRVRDGDPEAFRLVVERHQRPLINYFYRLTWDRHRSEDLAQEVFLRLFRARAGYRPEARFTTYLFRIARNLWIDRYRSLRSAPGEISLDGPIGGGDGGRERTLHDRLASPGRRPDEEAGTRELLAALREAVAGLSDEQAQVFTLGQMQGLPYAEISEILGIPEGTVKSRMHAAVKQLRGVLGRRVDDLAG